MIVIWGSERKNAKNKKSDSRGDKKVVNAAGRSRTYNLNFTAAMRGALLLAPSPDRGSGRFGKGGRIQCSRGLQIHTEPKPNAVASF